MTVSSVPKRLLLYPKDMEIKLLADHSEAIATLADWYITEWQPYYGELGPGDAESDLTSRCNRNLIPAGLVAVEDDQVIGTVALDVDPATNLNPSVVGLLVGSEYRRKGIATALLRSAKDLARDLAYRQLYLSSSVLGDLLVRTGWRVKGEVEFLNAEHGTIYVCDL